VCVRSAERGEGAAGDYRETLRRLRRARAALPAEAGVLLVAAVAARARHGPGDAEESALEEGCSVVEQALQAGETGPARPGAQVLEHMVETLLAEARRGAAGVEGRLAGVLQRMDAASVPPSVALVTSVCRLAAACRSEAAAAVAWQLLADFVPPARLSPECGEAALCAVCAAGCNRTRALHVIGVLRRKRALSARLFQAAADAAGQPETGAWLRRVMESVGVPGSLSLAGPSTAPPAPTVPAPHMADSGFSRHLHPPAPPVPAPAPPAPPGDAPPAGPPTAEPAPAPDAVRPCPGRRRPAGAVRALVVPGAALAAAATVGLPGLRMAGMLAGRMAALGLGRVWRGPGPASAVAAGTDGGRTARGHGGARPGAAGRTRGDVDMVDWVPDSAFDRA
jgi:hypothetical protein